MGEDTSVLPAGFFLSPSSSAAPRNEPKPWDLGHLEGLISNPTCRKFCLLSVLLDPDLGDEQQHTVPGC